MTATLLLAAEEPGADYPPLKPETAELIWGAIFFVLLFLFISRVVLPRINATLAARQQAVAGQVTAAEETRAEADQVLAEYRAKLADAQGEAQRIIEEGRRTAEQIVADARGRAEGEAEAIVSRAQSDIQIERDRAIAALRSELAGLSIELASRVVGQSLDGDAQRALVDRYIDELAGTGAGSSR